MAHFDKYGVKFSVDRKTLAKCPKDIQGEYVIPNSVTSIGNDAFLACLGLTSVTMGNGVSSIAYGAFSGCENLKEIRVPKGQKERFAQMEGLSELADLIVERENEE